MTTDNNTPLKDREFLADEVDELVRYCKNDLKFDIDDAMKESDPHDLKRTIDDLRRMLNSIEKEVNFPTQDEDEKTDSDDKKDEGPMVVLMSDQYWARARSFIKAKSMLHGEEPRLMYVTTDTKSFVNGMGSFAYDPRKPHFRIPLGFKVSGPNAGKPGEVEFYEPSND